jgi:hypothetical protein
VRKKRVTEKSEALLWPLLDKESELRAEYRRRNPKFDQRRIKLDELDAAQADGWRSLSGDLLDREQAPYSLKLTRVFKHPLVAITRRTAR